MPRSLQIKALTTFALLMLFTAGMQGQTPVDTLDEEDYFARKDTSMLTRINRAKETVATVNALDYVLRDSYTPPHHSFDRYWYDHIYVGGGFGFEQIRPQAEGLSFRTITQLSLFAGKQFDRENSLRLAIGGGWGYQRDENQWLRRISLRMDYLYNLSTHFCGYNPARRMEASLLLGVGTHCSWLPNSGKLLASEVRAGLQLKCYTGPLGTMSLEPYAGVASDRIDLSGTRNWRGYDITYGLNINYAFYLVDNLSREARLRLLQNRLASDRMVDAETMEKWRTPWFVEYSMGAVMSHSPSLGFTETLGNQTTMSLGRWLSPVMGFRLSVATRSTKWLSTGIDAYNSHYICGGVEAFLNPFGFSDSFRWDAPWGVYLAFGGSMGTLTKHCKDGWLRTTSESYNLGLHVFRALSEDMQAFIEPRFTHNVYTSADKPDSPLQLHGENSLAINLGLTMMVRSEKYHIPYEMDQTQDFIYRDIRGLRVGVGAGMPLFQRRGGYPEAQPAAWSAMAYAEYRFGKLHSVRGQADMLVADHRLLLASLNYEASLTNLCSGRLHKRNFELEAFLGPAVGLLQPKSAFELPEGQRKTMAGADFGLKFTVDVGKGFSVVLTPTSYLLYNAGPLAWLSTESVGDFRLYQTLNLGVQYKVGRLGRNPALLRERLKARDKRWEQRQVEKERRAQERLREKQKNRHRQ